ncbi:hypothetical protein IAR50_003791 [Cryptococcus sp. DSM 104548]
MLAVSRLNLGSGGDAKDETFLFTNNPHPSNQREEAVLLLGQKLCEKYEHKPPRKFYSDSEVEQFSQLAHRQNLHIDLPLVNYHGDHHLSYILAQMSRQQTSIVILNHRGHSYLASNAVPSGFAVTIEDYEYQNSQNAAQIEYGMIDHYDQLKEYDDDDDDEDEDDDDDEEDEDEDEKEERDRWARSE